MRPYIEINDELPSSIAELEKRMKLGRGKKKNVWKDITQALSFHFGLHFTSERVARKWQTLMVGYKNALDNNKQTGKSTSKFNWMTEMNELLGDRHDIHPVLTATQEGLTVHRQNELDMMSDTTSDKSTANEINSEINITPTSTTSASETAKDRKRKRPSKPDDNIDNLLKFMKESEEKSLETEQNILEELSDFNKSIRNLFLPNSSTRCEMQ